MFGLCFENELQNKILVDLSDYKKEDIFRVQTERQKNT